MTQWVGERLAVGSGNWTGPSGVTAIWINAIGAGGGGGNTGSSSNAAEGAGSGEFVLKLPLMIDSGEVIPYTVGAGGAGATAATGLTAGATGGSTTFGAGAHFAKVVVAGGFGGKNSVAGHLSGGGRGGALTVNTNNIPLAPTYEMPYWSGGSAGGPYVNAGSLLLSYPGPSIGHIRILGDPQPLAFNPSGGAGGGEGAPSPWGWGGFGGDGGATATSLGSTGGTPASDAYGAGGGGAGACGSSISTATVGGLGMDGTIEIFYFLP